MVYFFISAPADPTKNDTLNKCRDKVRETAEVFAYSLPDFKIGTLDQLVVLSDDLAKVDTSCESAAGKLADNLKNLLNGDIEQWSQNLVVGDKPVDQYVQTFAWNSMKYRADKSLRELCDLISQEVGNIDGVMKSKQAQYTAVKSQLGALQRKGTGNLAVRNLADVAKKDQFVLGSEYLTTLAVAVPKAAKAEWMATYETLSQMVVPRSSQLIAEDDEYCLFTVTLFTRVVDEFTQKAREKRFQVRDFKWDENAQEQEKKDLAHLQEAEKELWGNLLRLTKTNFGEIFSSWIHIKALRVYVESVLRYGLPPDFQPMIVKPKPKSEKKTRDALGQHFARLGGNAEVQDKKAKKQEFVMDESVQMLLGDKDYFPYVSYTVAWDPLGKKD